MNLFKRFLALMMVLCLTIGMVPFSAIAADTTEPVAAVAESVPEETETEPTETTEAATEVPTTEAPETTAAPAETTEVTEAATEAPEETVIVTEAPTEAPTEATEVPETTAATEATEADENKDTPADATVPTETEEVIEVVLVEENDASAEAVVGVVASVTPKPADGTTTGQPFNSGTGGSTYFRIPAMITTKTGRLVAAADARWGGTGDACGIDTLVSYSDDNGAKWNYTFANYLGDNNLQYVKNAATFIDPALAYDASSDTIYMLVDLYVANYAINTADNVPKTGSGFTSEGYLKLTSGDGNYNYYLKEGKIYNSSDAEVSGYSVDAYFNITGTDGTSSNLFFAETPYQAYPTTYLYLTKSTDGGETWGEPTLLNVKNDSEYFYGIGPGRGLVTSDGTIMYTCYVYGGSNDSQKASMIYSKDGGKTWTRTSNITSSIWSSETQLVELKDGTIRAFFRNGRSQICYADSKDMGSTWTVTETGISNQSNCQLSAVKYSELIDGKEAILVSCPTSTTDRTAGKVFVFTLNDDNSMNQAYTTSVTGGTYQYSCLTELANGDIGLLYENGAASIVYTSYEIADLAPGAKIGEDEGFVDGTTVVDSVTLGLYDAAKTYAFTGMNTDTHSIQITTEPDPLVATAVVSGAGIVITPVGVGSTKVVVTVRDYGRMTTMSVTAGDTFELGITVTGTDEYSGTVTNDTQIVYELDTDGIDSGEEYVIVYDDQYALLNNNGATSTSNMAVTVENSKITSLTEDTDNYVLWTFTGSDSTFSIRNTNAYLYPYDNKVLSTTEASCMLNGSSGLYTIYGYNAYLYWSGNNFATTWWDDNAADLHLYKKTVTSSGYAADLSKLEAQLAIAATYPKANDTGVYTAASWSAYTAALSAANALKAAGAGQYATEAEAQAKQNEIDSATRALAQAIAGLTYASRTVDITVEIGKTYEADAVGSEAAGFDANVADAFISAGKLTITGKNVGTTKVVDGVVTYNVTVTPAQIAVNLAAGGTYTAATTSTSAPANTNPDVATAEIADGILTITALTEGTTVVTDGNYQYNVSVTKHVTVDNSPVITGTGIPNNDGSVTTGPCTKLTISADLSYDLNVSDEYKDKTVTWKIADETIATVDENGTVTGVTAGETTLTVTIEGVGTYTIPVAVVDFTSDSGSEGTKIYNFHVMEVTNTKAYYVWNATTTVNEAQEGEVIYVAFDADADTCVAWFGNPDEGYALTRMSSTNSDSAFFRTHTGDGMTVDETSEGYLNGQTYVNGTLTSGAGKNQVATFGEAAVRAMLNAVIPLGCDGGMGFTRPSSNTSSVNSTLTFRSEQLPTIDKSIVGILGESGKQADWHTYSEGMYAKVGQYIFFQIDVDKYEEAEGEAIDYTPNTGDAVILTDVLPGAFFTDGSFDYDFENEEITIHKLAEAQQYDDGSYYIDLTQVFEDAASDAVSKTYYVVYQIQPGDLGKTVKNTAKLEYNYKAQFSSGALSDSADAEASMQIIGDTISDVVIDFGQPVVINVTASHASTMFDEDKTNNAQGGCKYGTVAIDVDENGNGTVTYTPNKVLQGRDVVYLLDEDGNLYNYFRVYPATTVYYEDGFLTSDTWSTNAVPTTAQTTQVLGKSTDNYGYDANATNDSAAASSSDLGNMASFSFTGTGFEVYADCTTGTGYVSVELKQGNVTKKMYMVDTVAKSGTTGATTGQDTNLNSLPIVRMTGLAHGSYTVNLRKIIDAGEPVQIDGFRVINTMADSTIFTDDLEDNPEFFELRNAVLQAMNIADDTSAKYGTLDKMVDQVYSQIGDNTALIIDENTNVNYPSDTTAQDLLDNGPKNELFLHAGQKLVFKVKTSRALQLGMKAPAGDTSYSITGATATAKTGNIKTSTDQFYALGNATGTETTYTITVENTHSDNILSITTLKICDDPNAAFVALSESDIENVLIDMGYTNGEEIPEETVPEETIPEETIPEETEPEIVYADASVTVKLVDYTGKELAAVELTANGAEGETAVFTAEEILAAAEEQMPEGYALANEAAVKAVQVAYGASADAKVQVGEVATLNVTFINLFGKKLFSASISRVQTSAGNWKVSASEIRGLAPAGRRAVWFFSVNVPYGRTSSIAVPMF